jgi:hypothetical protein
MQNISQPTLKVITSRGAALFGLGVSLLFFKIAYDMWGVPPRPGSRSLGLFGDVLMVAVGLAALVFPVARWRQWPILELTPDGIVIWRLFRPHVCIDWADIDSAWIHKTGARGAGNFVGWGLVVHGKWRRADGVAAEMDPSYGAACFGMDHTRNELGDALDQRLAALPGDGSLHIPRQIEGSAYAFRWHRVRAAAMGATP